VDEHRREPMASGARLLNDRYEVTSVAGRGGEGTVVKATDLRHGRSVALKVRRTPDDAANADRFLVEARTLLSLRPHPALPLARDDFFDGDRHVLVLDWVDGVDLATVLESQGLPGLPMSTVVRWLAPVAEALTHLHHSDPPIVHGDVKPANIIVRPNGDVVLVDFGMSSVPGVLPRGGTPGFRAPEVAAGGSPSRAADVYGLAATAFALLTGAPPAGMMPDWQDLEPARTARLEAGLRRAMATDPTQRTATPGEFIEELRSGWDVEALATGVVTLIATELIGDSRLWEAEPVSASEQVTTYSTIIDRVVERYGGRRVGSSGTDATLSDFVRGGDALRASIELQRELRTLSVPVRCALHAGEETLIEGRLGGPAVRRVVALCGMSEAGQVLLTESVARLVGGDLPADVRLLHLGSHHLRGIDESAMIVALDAPGLVVPPDPGQPPYPGLIAFQAADRDLFFGREDVVQQIVERVRPGRAVAVVGASGTGKSSLVRAGVLPRLAGAALLTPTANPIAALSAAGPAAGPLVVDQFEELFSLCADNQQREQFAQALIEHAGGCLVAIRADLYGRLAELPALAEAVARDHILLGRLTDDELRQAIELPATIRGLTIEPGLTDVVLADARAEPGALPHVAHALRETWLRREGRRLTVAGYQAAGGVRGALAQTAEDFFATLNDHERELLSVMLLRMVEPGEGVADSRRRVAITDLVSLDPSAYSLLQRLADCRLVTIEHDTIEPAHEALLRDWPRLRAWVDDARDDIKLQRSITESANEWARQERHPTQLLRGPRLAVAADWADRRRASMTDLEQTFVAESTAQSRSELNEARRTTRRLKRLVSVVAMLLACALVAGAIALTQRTEARRQRSNAEQQRTTAEEQRSQAEQQRTAAQLQTQFAQTLAHNEQVTRLASEARSGATNQIDVSLLLAVEASLRGPSEVTDAALLDALGTAGSLQLVRSSPIVDAVPRLVDDLDRVWSVGGDEYAAQSAQDGTTIARGRPRPGHEIRLVQPFRDGSRLALSYDDALLQIVDITTGVEKARRPNAAPFAFAEIGDVVIAVLTEIDVVKILSPVDLSEIGSFPLNADFRGLASSGPNALVADFFGRAWVFTPEGAGGDPVTLGATVNGGGVAPGGRVAAAGLSDGRLVVWNTDTGAVTTLEALDRRVQVSTAAFSSDGQQVLVGREDGDIFAIDLRTPSVASLVARIGEPVADIRFEGDGTTLVAVGATRWYRFTTDARSAIAVPLLSGLSADSVGVSNGQLFVGRTPGVVEVRSLSDGSPIRSVVVGENALVAAVIADASGFVASVVELPGADLPALKALQTKIGVDTATGIVAVQFRDIQRSSIVSVSGDGAVSWRTTMPAPVVSIVKLPDGAVAALDANGVLSVLEPTTGIVRASAVGAFHHAGYRLVVAGNDLLATGQTGEIQRFRVRDGQVVADTTVTPGWALDGGETEVLMQRTGGLVGRALVSDLTWSEQPAHVSGQDGVRVPGTDVIATDRGAGGVDVWRLGTRVSRFEMPGSVVLSIVPAGSDQFVTMDFAGRIDRWNIGRPNLRTRACSLAGRDLTPSEWSAHLPGEVQRSTCAASAET
jgi:tRNA A-37 threonylcarbamoyl transferase component Bud32/energy-coupling factor transporter ATP-binding protein EcfA2